MSNSRKRCRRPGRKGQSHMAALGGVAAVVYPGVTWGHFDSWANWSGYAADNSHLHMTRKWPWT